MRQINVWINHSERVHAACISTVHINLIVFNPMHACISQLTWRHAASNLVASAAVRNLVASAAYRSKRVNTVVHVWIQWTTCEYNGLSRNCASICVHLIWSFLPIPSITTLGVSLLGMKLNGRNYIIILLFYVNSSDSDTTVYQKIPLYFYNQFKWISTSINYMRGQIQSPGARTG